MDLRDTSALPVASFFLVAGVMGSRPLVPLMAVELGIGTAEIGVLVAAFAFVPLVLAAFAGPWIDRNGSGPPLLFGIVTAVLGVCTPGLDSPCSSWLGKSLQKWVARDCRVRGR